MFRLNASVVISVKEKHHQQKHYSLALMQELIETEIISIDAAFLVNIPLGQSYLTAQHVTSPLYFCTL